MYSYRDAARDVAPEPDAGCPASHLIRICYNRIFHNFGIEWSLCRREQFIREALIRLR